MNDRLLGIIIGFVMGLVLAIAVCDMAHAQEAATITYSFEGVHHGAWHDAKVHWNQAASSAGAPLLMHARPGERPDLTVTTMCRGYYNNAVVRGDRALLVNRCNRFTREESRMLYSHELGHVYRLPHSKRSSGRTVMEPYLEDIRVLYPSARDVRELRRRWY